MTRKRMRECRTQAEGCRSSAAADPERQLPDPGQPVIASRGRMMQVMTHAAVTLPRCGGAVLCRGCCAVSLCCAVWRYRAGQALTAVRPGATMGAPQGRVAQLALSHLDDRFRKRSELVNHDQSADKSSPKVGYAQRSQRRCQRC